MWQDSKVSENHAASLFTLELYYPAISLHGVTSPKTWYGIFIAVMTSNLASRLKTRMKKYWN
jgi:hypothetical protein